MLTDYHCHILPKMDDGSESVEMSIKMLEMMKLQGVVGLLQLRIFMLTGKEV